MTHANGKKNITATGEVVGDKESAIPVQAPVPPVSSLILSSCIKRELDEHDVTTSQKDPKRAKEEPNLGPHTVEIHAKELLKKLDEAEARRHRASMRSEEAELKVSELSAQLKKLRAQLKEAKEDMRLSQECLQDAVKVYTKALSSSNTANRMVKMLRVKEQSCDEKKIRAGA